MYWANGYARSLSAKDDPLTSLAFSRLASPSSPVTPLSPSSLAATLKPSASIRALAPSPSNLLFATVSRNTLHVWKVKPSVVLCKITRSPSSVEEHGENYGVLWKADGSSLAVLTTAGFILIYAIVREENASTFQFQFTTPHHFVPGPGQGRHEIVHRSLEFRAAIEMDGGIADAIALPKELLVCTRQPPALQSLSWVEDRGVCLLRSTLTPELTALYRNDGNPNAKEEGVRVVQIWHDQTLNLYGMVTADARLAICRRTIINNENTRSARRRQEGREGDDATDDEASWSSPKPSRRLVPKPSVAVWKPIKFETRSVAEKSTRTSENEKPSEPDTAPTPTPPAEQPRPNNDSSSSVTSTLSGCTCLAFNPPFGLIAIAIENGEVLIYKIPETPSENRSPDYDLRTTLLFSHKLVLKNPLAGNSGRSPGLISSLAWTSDGLALAAGYVDDGFAVWSVYGWLMTSTWLEGDDLPESFQDTYIFGVQSLFWGPQNHELFMFHTPLSTEEPDQLFVLPFAKASVASYHTMENVKHSYLEMDDRLLMYRGDQREVVNINSDAQPWNVVQFPTVYVTDNWPIRYSSINGDGSHVAVAGFRGMALYNGTADKWKLFGNQHQEREFACRGGLVWYKNLIIVACETFARPGYEIRFYPRDKNLDHSQLLHVEPMKAPVVLMSIVGSSLLVYTMDNVMYHYHITEAPEYGPGKIKSSLIQQISLGRVIFCNPDHVKSVTWFRVEAHDNDPTPSELLRSPLLFLAEGRLFMLVPFMEGEEQTVEYQCLNLCDQTEYFWLADRGVEDFSNSLWSCTGNSLRIWNSFSLTNSSSPLEGTEPDRDRFEMKPLQFALEFYPLSMPLKYGTVVGIEQNISLRNSLEMAEFKAVSKRNLFIHHVVRHLLSRRMQNEAVVFARRYQHLSYFGHALELVLHNVLEDEAESVGSAEDAVLPRVVAFLRCFPCFLDVIVRCARKTEVAVWEYLFGIVGPPKELFQECLLAGNLKLAASYLIILQTLEPLSVSTKDSISLLEKALETEDYELSKELVRFLNSINGGGDPSAEPMLPNNQMRRLSMSMQNGEKTFDLETTISFHGRKLLRAGRVRTLKNLMKAVSFSLTEWLSKESNTTAIVEDFHFALNALHKQYNLPLPSRPTTDDAEQDRSKAAEVSQQYRRRESHVGISSLAPSQIVHVSFLNDSMSRRNSMSSSNIISTATQPVHSGPRKKRTHSTAAASLLQQEGLDSETEEARAMLSVMRGAECWHWTVLFSCLLYDIPSFVNAYGRLGEEAEKLKKALADQNSSGYRHLLTILEDIDAKQSRPVE